MPYACRHKALPRTLPGTTTTAIVLLITASFLCSCGRAKRDYEESEQANTIEAYETFLHNNPRSEFAVQASNKVARLHEDEAWLQASNKSSIDGLQQFLKLYSNSTYSAQARLCLENLFQAEWKSIRLGLNRQEYTDFVAMEPPAPLLEEAKLMQRIVDQAKQMETSGLAFVEATVAQFDQRPGPDDFFTFAFRLEKPVSMGSMQVHFLQDKTRVPEFVSQQPAYEPGDAVLLVMGTARGAFGPERKIVGILKKQDPK